MKKRLLLAMAAVMLGTATMMAVPAKPGLKKKVTLADGTTVELALHGDEHYSYYTDAEGTPCQLQNGRLVKMSRSEVAKTWEARREHRLALVENASMGRRAARRAGTPSKTTTGTQRGLVILMEFKDVKFVTKNPQPTFQRFFNEEGYNEGGMAGSVRDYFKAQSYGKLTIDFDVAGPYTTTEDMAYYGAHYKEDDEEENDTHPALMVAEAVDAAHNDGVDFSKYDWDGDGEVDQVFVIYAGYAEAQGGAPETIWPHEWVLSAENASRKYNGVRINTYGCAAELRGKSGSTLDGIGTACHEFSHCLGLPDMYDTGGQNNYAMSYWDIMCAGNYNNNSCTPAGYTSYERWFSGWLEPVELKTETEVKNMQPIATTPEAYVLYNEKNKNEYYLLENRQPVGFDAGLPGHGMLILHVDYSKSAWTSNTLNNVASHQRMTVIPADNDFTESRSGMAGDPWPGTKNNTYLGNYTTPAATLFNDNVDGTKLMSKSINAITEDVNAKTISFVACHPDMAAPDVAEATEVAGENSFTVTWPAVSGAVGYEVELTTIDRAASTPDEALMTRYDFSKFVSEKNGYTDISAKSSDMKTYGLENWKGSKLFTSPKKLKIGTSTVSGYIQTPSWWLADDSKEMTFVMGADVVTEDKAVKGVLTFESAINGGTSATIVKENVDFEVTGDSRQVFSFKLPNVNDLFRLTITPSSQMYLNYLAIYGGTWTAEQLGISNTPAQASRRAATVETFTTTTNSYTFTNLDTNKRFVYRLRALGEGGIYSAWSEEKNFEFTTTGIESIRTDAVEDSTVRYYDLQGREVPVGTKGLLIRKQGSSVRKVSVAK